MGRTGIYNTTPEEARLYELGVTSDYNTIVAKSGSWYITKPGPARETPSEHFCLSIVQTKCFGSRWAGVHGEVCTKDVESGQGPYQAAPEPILRKYLKLAASIGQFLSAREIEWVARCEAVYIRRHALAAIKDGDTFTTEPISWLCGGTYTEYVMAGKYITPTGSSIFYPRRLRKPRNLADRLVLA
jgi:hypothetical protein